MARPACRCGCLLLLLLLALAPLACLLLSCLSSAFPAHYYAVRYHPYVRAALRLAAARPSRPGSGLGRGRPHLRDVTPSAPDQVVGLLRAAYAKEFPMVIRGGVAHWPAAGAWSPGHVADRAGRGDWVVLQTGVQEQEAAPFVNTTIGAFADWLTADAAAAAAAAADTDTGEEDTRHGEWAAKRPAFYMAEEFDWVEHHPDLVNELRLEGMHSFWRNELKWNTHGKVSGMFNTLLGPWWRARANGAVQAALGTDAPVSLFTSSGFETAFWMGAGGARTGWHLDHDFPLNVLCHLYGRKRLWIASPDQTPAMYPSNRYDPGAVLSSVNMWAPYGADAGSAGADAAAKFPLYAGLELDEVLLEPGDVLFIPQGWWHAAETSREGGPSVSLSVRSMTPWFWLRNFPDRLLEQMFWWGMFDPGEGNVEKGQTVVRESLVGGGLPVEL